MIVFIKKYKKIYISAHVYGGCYFIRAFSKLYSDTTDKTPPIEGEELWTRSLDKIDTQETFVDKFKFLLWLFKAAAKSEFETYSERERFLYTLVRVISQY